MNDYVKGYEERLESAQEALRRAEAALEQAKARAAQPHCQAVLGPQRKPCSGLQRAAVTVSVLNRGTDAFYDEVPVCRMHAWIEAERQQQINPDATVRIRLAEDGLG